MPKARYGSDNSNFGKRWSREKREEASETHKQSFQNGRVVWNKGLTKDDPRVAKYAIALVGNKFGEANHGKKHPLLSLRNMVDNPIWRPEVKEKVGAKLSKRFRGAGNPNYRGGKKGDGYRGRDWKKNRELALKRDMHECQTFNCSTSVGLVVHHKKRYRDSRDNSLDNLITLCHSCHCKVEPIEKMTQKQKEERNAARTHGI